VENATISPFSIEILNVQVGRIFHIEDITLGKVNPESQTAELEKGGQMEQPAQRTGSRKGLKAPRQTELDYIVRYRGRLVSEDSEAAYDALSAWLKPFNITPLFRRDGERHAIFLIRGMAAPKPSNPWINLILFVLTLMSVLLTGALYGLQDPLPTGLIPAALALIQRGWPFAVSMLAILAAHEFGHYLAGRYHGLHVTLPYFIPFPFSPFGTMGAFINMKGIPKNRRVLMDVGIAGPLAGLVIALPVLFIGLKISNVELLPLVAPAGAAVQMEGNSLLYLLVKFLVFGRLLPEPVAYQLPPILHWVAFFFSGRPSPLGGMDVMLSPVAWAGWAGLLVTGLNLLPAGQLDGGHIVYVLMGEKVIRRLYPFVILSALLLGIFWSGWWLWALLLYFLGRAYAQPLDQITPLDPVRKALGVLAIVVFLLTFVPVPLRILM
jgi:Zn-dependent protease